MKVIIIITKQFISILYFILLISCLEDSRDSVSSATWRNTGEIQAIAVESLKVEHSKLIKSIESSGIIKGSKEAWIVSETQGIIRKTNIELGKNVNKDDVIIVINNDLQKLTVDLNNEQLKKTKFDLEANKLAFENGNISRATYDQFRINYLQAKTRYKQSILDLDKTYIRVPFNGEVALLENSIIEGNYINRGTKIAKIVDLTKLKIEIPLGERQVGLITTGLKALITLNINGEAVSFKGSVEAIGSGNNTQTGSFPVIVSWINNQEMKIRSGFSANVKIETIGKANQIIIPVNSLVIRNRNEGIFIEKDGKAYFKKVKKSQLFSGKVIITEGLSPGENLIISGFGSIGNEYPVKSTIVGKTGDWE